jgi:hypothetical protein
MCFALYTVYTVELGDAAVRSRPQIPQVGFLWVVLAAARVGFFVFQVVTVVVTQPGG